jgi:hypothetical protein
MQRNTVGRTLGIAGVLGFGSIAIAHAQQQTAPPASGTSTPPAATARAPAPVNHLPYWLTASAQWPEVDCGTAKLATTASQPRCQRGPAFETTGTSLDLDEAHDNGGHGCVFEGWNVSTHSPTNFGFAQLINVRDLVFGCGVRYRNGGIAAALKGGPTFPTNGTGWSDVSQMGDIYTARFTSAGGENCRAFAKFGPPWASGSVWAAHGWLCGIQGNSVQDRDLQSFVDALVIRVP